MTMIYILVVKKLVTMIQTLISELEVSELQEVHFGIEVDELGSKAAAFTGVSFGVKGIASINKNEWIFDRPLLL